MCTEHFSPLLEQIAQLEEALYNIQFEQHWLDAQTDRQALGNIVSFEHAIFHGVNPICELTWLWIAVNENMSKRALQKAMFESAFLVGASVLQVFLLKHLFDRKRGLPRV